MVAIEADAQGCSVTLQSETALVVSGDVELLRSSFENIIRNAVRYSPPDAQVGITARRMLTGDRTEDCIEVIVYDHGPGVPDKDLELIFEPFYRVDAARDRAGGGEGLGLAIAARAVALHDGAIEARNRQNGGLIVSVVLPAGGRVETGEIDAASQVSSADAPRRDAARERAVKGAEV